MWKKRPVKQRMSSRGKQAEKVTQRKSNRESQSRESQSRESQSRESQAQKAEQKERNQAQKAERKALEQMVNIMLAMPHRGKAPLAARTNSEGLLPECYFRKSRTTVSGPFRPIGIEPTVTRVSYQ
ncbi:hypothetical protein TNCV_1550051 [Trichonephila clavipes]|uniref:Uncharacterized protein n=1 Tax=Trichonephila clavipes TaxID=2585209 RepID=A0A8X6RPF5_TRICX|nr:hypothetical protein TNCV_1550051 [Trichonephila clavipes]